MAYSVENGIWSNIFAVPCAVVDKHLKLCGAASLKVLLIILRRGGATTIDELSGQLSLSAADVQDALNYWIHLGVIRDNGQDLALLQAGEAALSPQPEQPEPVAQAQPAEAAPEPAPEPEKPRTKPGATRPKLTTRQINEMSRADKNITFLLQEAQSVLGKPLTPVITDTVTGLYAYHGMKPDLILMLLSYCVSIGKDSMNYVNKVAAGWIEKGIDSHEKAEQELLRAAQRGDVESKVKQVMGIYDRDLVPAEREYIEKWVEQYGFSMDVIQIAHERTVELKGKLSFQYTNGILKNWAEKGVTTTRQAAKEIAHNKGGGKKGDAKAKASYDIEELDNLITYGEF